MVPVLDSTMAYVEAGAGKPIVFLHGNPTSSYLWRNVMPHLSGLGRCLAPDLIGMGRSGKNPAGRYRFVDHARYLDAWFEAVGVARDAVLVVHDWGSALGFHWARRHPDRVRGIAYMEAIVTPVTWADWPESARKIFQAMRSPAGEEMVLDKNVFVERILPASILRKLSPEEHDAYRAPFREAGESRRPTLDLAARDPDRGRAQGRSRHRRGLWRVACREQAAQALRQCRARLDPGRPSARDLPRLAEPDRGHRQGTAFHPGRQRGRDRRGRRGLCAPAWRLINMRQLDR